jgi:hypothetical protein
LLHIMLDVMSGVPKNTNIPGRMGTPD